MSYYIQPADIKARYNDQNAAMMADPGMTGSQTEQLARMQLACNLADDWINGFLLKSLYSHTLPGIVDRSGNIPGMLKNAAVMWCGWWLSTSHGVRDYDKDNKPINRYAADYQAAEKIMLMIQGGENFLLNVET